MFPFPLAFGILLPLLISDAEGFEVFLKETVYVGQGGGVTGILVNVVVVESSLAGASSVFEGEGELLGMLTASKHPLLG